MSEAKQHESLRYNREIERKFVVEEPGSYAAIEAAVCQFLHHWFPYQATSNDRFWRAPGVDFVRLRPNSNELTIKVTDQKTIRNRIEENVIVKDLETAARFTTLLFGEPVMLTKTFTVWNTALPGALGPIVVSLYRVEGDARIFLEVEGNSEVDVEQAAHTFQEHFKLRPEWRSLFQIFFGGSGV